MLFLIVLSHSAHLRPEKTPNATSNTQIGEAWSVDSHAGEIQSNDDIPTVKQQLRLCLSLMKWAIECTLERDSRAETGRSFQYLIVGEVYVPKSISIHDYRTPDTSDGMVISVIIRHPELNCKPLFT